MEKWAFWAVSPCNVWTGSSPPAERRDLGFASAPVHRPPGRALGLEVTCWFYFGGRFGTYRPSITAAVVFTATNRIEFFLNFFMTRITAAVVFTATNYIEFVYLRLGFHRLFCQGCRTFSTPSRTAYSRFNHTHQHSWTCATRCRATSCTHLKQKLPCSKPSTLNHKPETLNPKP